MRISIGPDEVAIIEGREGTLAIAKTLGNFFYLETSDEEIVLFTEDDDLIVASSFGVAANVRRSLRCTIFQIREMGSPLIVLPRGHPASPRLNTVVSIGPMTRLLCDIEPGTHPEQDVLCSASEFAGLDVSGDHGGAQIDGFEGDVLIDKL